MVVPGASDEDFPPGTASQFEPDEDRHVLHVHIPEGEPLDDAACGESFCDSGGVFRTRVYDI
ncbi:MAG: hypothetical protein ACLUUO_08595 [Sellimonas intestinalis]